MVYQRKSKPQPVATIDNDEEEKQNAKDENDNNNEETQNSKDEDANAAESENDKAATEDDDEAKKEEDGDKAKEENPSTESAAVAVPSNDDQSDKPEAETEPPVASSEPTDDEVALKEITPTVATDDDDEIDINVDDLVVDLDHLAEDSGLVPGFIASMRNEPFRILLIGEILESLGDQLQYTILPFVVKYVIMPQDLTYDTAYTLLAGVVLICELASVPFWMFLVRLVALATRNAHQT